MLKLIFSGNAERLFFKSKYISVILQAITNGKHFFYDFKEQQ
jgi:hypothetical protein